MSGIGSAASCLWNLPQCAENKAGGVAASTVPAAWTDICKSFVTAASDLMQAFAQGFVKIPNVDPADAGISQAYAASLAIGAVIAVLLVFGAIVRTALTHDGTALAQGVSGVAKAVVTWLATAAVASAALSASDEVSEFVVTKTFGSQQAFVARLGNIVNWSMVAGKPGQAIVGVSMALVIALIGIVLLIVLWLEMLLRNTALAVLLAVSPIAAAGQVSETTKAWWQRTASAAAQLIILKPVVAIVFAVGFAMAGKSQGVEAVLAGLLALGLAVFAWPVIARFFTFATVQSTSSGLATALGFAAGRLSGGESGGTAGVEPSQWSLNAERQTMAARGDESGGGGAAGAGAGGGAASGGMPGGAGGGGAGGPAGGGGGGSAAAAGLGFMLSALHRMGTMAAGRMEQTAGHAGMEGRYPYSTVGNGQRGGPSRSRGTASANGAAVGGDQKGAGPGPADGRAPDADGAREDRVREGTVPPADPGNGQDAPYDEQAVQDRNPKSGYADQGTGADGGLGGSGGGTGATGPGADGQAPGQPWPEEPRDAQSRQSGPSQGEPEPMVNPGFGGEPGVPGTESGATGDGGGMSGGGEL